MLLFIILIHIALLAIALLGKGKGCRLDSGSLLLALILPIFGPLSVLVIRSAEKEAAVRPKSQKETQNTSDALTGKLSVRPLNASAIVPLEDALILDAAVQRRSLILNVLNDDPTDYLDILKEAQSNDDGEVVHYATTALAEQFSMADRNLQNAEKAHQEKPDDLGNIRVLANVLREYIALGTAQGAAARIRQEEYAQLLERLLEQEPRLEDTAELCRTYLNLKNDSKAATALEMMKVNWPRSEELFVLSLEYAWSINNRTLASTLLRQARDGDFLLSKKTQEQFSIWINKEENA